MPDESITPEEMQRRFGVRLEAFAELLSSGAKEHKILGFACIVMTETGIHVISGGDPNEEWRATLRQIAKRTANELGQVLIARGVATKPEKPS